MATPRKTKAMAGERGGLGVEAEALHPRVLAREPTTTADATDLLLRPLVGRLTSRWPNLRRTDDCHDAAVDALVAYFLNPESYDPSRASLLGWLEMQAHRDLVNKHHAARTRFERDWVTHSAGEAGDVQMLLETVQSDVEPLTWIEVADLFDASALSSATRAIASCSGSWPLRASDRQ